MYFTWKIFPTWRNANKYTNHDNNGEENFKWFKKVHIYLLSSLIDVALNTKSKSRLQEIRPPVCLVCFG
jgi:hypothetical protein